MSETPDWRDNLTVHPAFELGQLIRSRDVGLQTKLLRVLEESGETVVVVDYSPDRTMIACAGRLKVTIEREPFTPDERDVQIDFENYGDQSAEQVSQSKSVPDIAGRDILP